MILEGCDGRKRCIVTGVAGSGGLDIGFEKNRFHSRAAHILTRVIIVVACIVEDWMRAGTRSRSSFQTIH